MVKAGSVVLAEPVVVSAVVNSPWAVFDTNRQTLTIRQTEADREKHRQTDRDTEMQTQSIIGFSCQDQHL